MRSIFLNENPETINRVYAPETIQWLEEHAGLYNHVFAKADALADPGRFADTEFIFSSWNMPVFTQEEIRWCFPSVKRVFYGAGTVQEFARPFLELGIRVHSAWAANAVPVAEYTVAQIILANKGFFASSRLLSEGNIQESYRLRRIYPGNYDLTVGLIGVGQISRLVIRMLKTYDVRIKVCSRSLCDQEAERLGVEKCSLEEIFSTCQVVSNHLANNTSTQRILRGHHFASMLPYATFLNTGRGAQVAEEELASVLAQRTDLTAVLDVTHPEPPEKGHPFYSLPNCFLTPHIAGSNGNEVHRMALYMAQEFERSQCGTPCLYEVTMKMLETMA